MGALFAAILLYSTIESVLFGIVFYVFLLLLWGKIFGLKSILLLGTLPPIIMEVETYPK